MELCGISTGLKDIMVGGLLANVGIGFVLPILSYSLATGAPVDEFLGKVFAITQPSNVVSKNVFLWSRQIPCVKWQAFVAA